MTCVQTPRPADACPYSRPFPDDFDDCNAYRGRRYVPLDLAHEPLRPVWTCEHLTVRRAEDETGAFYASCRLGTAVDRTRWLADVTAERVRQLKVLQVEMQRLTEPFMLQLWAAKGAQLAAAGEGHRSQAETRHLESLASEMGALVNGYIDQHHLAFEELSLPVDATKRMVDYMLRRLVTDSSASTDYRLPDDILDQFPVEVRPLVDPGGPRSGPSGP